MKTLKTNHIPNKIRTALIGTALVAAASYVSPVDAAMIFGAIGDDLTGPPGAFDGSITVTANRGWVAKRFTRLMAQAS